MKKETEPVHVTGLVSTGIDLEGYGCSIVSTSDGYTYCLRNHDDGSLWHVGELISELME